MACINMINSDHQGLCSAPPMSPRISFSSDFAVEAPARAPPGPPPDPNFEFAVGGDSMIDADQLFFKGRLLPLKESGGGGGGGHHTGRPLRGTTTTLRDELLAAADNDEGEEGVAAQWERAAPMRGSIKWKELLGLKKPICGLAAVPLPPKKGDKAEELLKPAQDQ